MNRLRRAERWHHSNRKKEKAKKILNEWHGWWDHDYFPSDRAIGKVARTPKPCSCWMCCNERRHKKYVENYVEKDKEGVTHRLQKIHTISKKDRLTRQERKNIQSFQEQLNELK